MLGRTLVITSNIIEYDTLTPKIKSGYATSKGFHKK